MIRYSLKQLRYFVAAAELRSTCEAARVVHVSQPSIATAISQLESVFGRVLLFRQQGQGVAPTPYGREVLGRANKLLALAEDLHGGSSDTPTGNVSIGYFSSLGPYFLPALARRLRNRFPSIGPAFVEGDFDSLPRALARGDVDMAITYDVLLGEAMQKEPLAKVVPHALLPANHTLARRKRVSLERLLAEPFVLSDPQYSRDYVLALISGRGLEPRIAFKVQSFEMLRGLVANGLGVSLVYTRTRSDRSYDGRRLVHCPLSDDLPGQDIVLVRHRDAYLTLANAAVWKEIHDLSSRIEL